jgi:hypothetical protein
MANDGKYFEQALESDLALKKAAFDREAAEVFLEPEPTVHYDIPVIDAEQFGRFAKDVNQTVQMVRRFLAMPATQFRFPNHQAWSDWKKEMRAKYGQDFANEQLKRFDNNKRRKNTLAGIRMACDSVVFALEHGDERDQAFAVGLELAWGPKDFTEQVEVYYLLTPEEGAKMMPYFDGKALELLQLLHDEGERRAMRSLPREDSQEAAIAAK